MHEVSHAKSRKPKLLLDNDLQGVLPNNAPRSSSIGSFYEAKGRVAISAVQDFVCDSAYACFHAAGGFGMGSSVR